MVEASDFKFGMQFDFCKAHHKITPRGKSRPGHGLGELPKIFQLPFNIFATAEASDIKFGMQFGFSKAHYKKLHPEEKWAWPWVRRVPQDFRVPL